jgi:glutamate dehydrogenase
MLPEMTDEVSALVLKNNYEQTRAIRMIEAAAPELLEDHTHLTRELEAEGLLDRRVELLPTDEELDERRAAA